MARIDNIIEQAKENEFFRVVLETGHYSQIALMSILAGDEVGEAVTPDSDQIIFVVEGGGEATVNNHAYFCKPGDMFVVPAGIKHNFKTVSKSAMKIITIYSPPHFLQSAVHRTKTRSDTVAGIAATATVIASSLQVL